MKTFNHFLLEAEDQSTNIPVKDTKVFTMGKLDPYHPQHAEMQKFAQEKGKEYGADVSHLMSRSPKRILPFERRHHYANKLSPKTGANIETNPEIRTIFNAVQDAGKRGYKDIRFVGGSDRIQAGADSLLDPLRRGLRDGYFPGVENIEGIQYGGDRSAEGEGPTATSSSGIRKLIQGNDLDKLAEIYSGFGDISSEDRERTLAQMFEEYREAMQRLKQQNNSFIPDLDSRNMICEAYKNGELFNEGDWVFSDRLELIGQIKRCGANHVICVSEEGFMFKEFIYDIESI